MQILDTPEPIDHHFPRRSWQTLTFFLLLSLLGGTLIGTSTTAVDAWICPNYFHTIYLDEIWDEGDWYQNVWVGTQYGFLFGIPLTFFS